MRQHSASVTTFDWLASAELSLFTMPGIQHCSCLGLDGVDGDVSLACDWCMASRTLRPVRTARCRKYRAEPNVPTRALNQGMYVCVCRFLSHEIQVFCW